MRVAAQFHLPRPPTLDSSAYAQPFNEVAALGGDGVNADAAHGGADGDRPLLGFHSTPWRRIPPQMYNRIAVRLLLERMTFRWTRRTPSRW